MHNFALLYYQLLHRHHVSLSIQYFLIHFISFWDSSVSGIVCELLVLLPFSSIRCNFELNRLALFSEPKVYRRLSTQYRNILNITNVKGDVERRDEASNRLQIKRYICDLSLMVKYFSEGKTVLFNNALKSKEMMLKHDLLGRSLV